MSMTPETAMREEIEDLRRDVEIARENVEEIIDHLAIALAQRQPHSDLLERERNLAVVRWVRMRGVLAARELELDDLIDSLRHDSPRRMRRSG
ncbi:MAG: hypothetical protein R6W48_04455 [Gaiellaceae bacterium]